MMIQRNRLRAYHFGATLIAIGIALWALVWVQEIQETTKANLEQTQCNQGLLTLATLDVWVERKISYCPADLQDALRRERK